MSKIQGYEKGDAKLEALIVEVKERINNLKLFDRASEINAHCDDLVEQVALEVQSNVERLDQTQAKLVDEINKYRDELLQNVVEIEKTNQDQLKLELQSLMNEVETVRDQGEAALKSVMKLIERASELKLQLRQQTFTSGFMQFEKEEEHADFYHIGKLMMSHKDPDAISFEYLYIDKYSHKSFSCKLKNTVNQEDLWLRKLLFLNDGNLAVLISKQPVLIWNTETKETLFELKSRDRWSPINAVVQLTCGLVVTGDDQGFIDVWDLEKRQIVKTLKQESGIEFLGALQNGRLASLSVQNSRFDPDEKRYIIVWCTSEDAEWSPLIKIPCPSCLLDTEVLADGNLAFTYKSYYYSETGLTYIEWRNSNDGKYLGYTNIQEGNYIFDTIFPSGDVVLMPSHDVAVIYTMGTERREKHRATIEAYGRMLITMQLSSHAYRIVCLKKISSVLPSNSNGQDKSWISTSVISPDGTRIALGTSKGEIIVVPLTD